MEQRSITGVQFRMARAALGWTVRGLSEKAGVHKNTVMRVEADLASHGPTIDAVRRTLENAGIEFLEPVKGVAGPGVRLKWGVEVPQRLQGAPGAEPAGDPTLEALSWDWEDQEPVPPEIEELREYWRARPAEWARMHASSRWALLQEMRIRGV